MKKLIFMAAFAVAGTMSANTIAVETETLPEELQQKTQTEAKAYGCVNVTLSCGYTGVACGETLGDIIDVVLAADDYLCGN